MRTRTLVVTALACVLAPMALAAPAFEPTVLTHSASAETRVEGQTLHGIAKGGRRAFYVELVRALLAELGIEDRIQDVPFARGLMLVQEQDGIVFFNVDRTPEREDRMQWVGPISSDLDVLYENAERPTGVQSLDDARAKRICVLRDNVHDRRLSALGFGELERARSYTQCLRLLDAGRVDLAASAVETMPAKLVAAQVDPRRIRRTPVVLMRTEGYIALSKSTPPSELARWADALARLKASGRYQALAERYVGAR